MNDHIQRRWLLLGGAVFSLSLLIYYIFFTADVQTSATIDNWPEEKEQGLYVYVSGAVDRPGVYELPAGSRANDALAAAGNQLPYADLAEVNLAQSLEDGMHVHIPYNFAPPETELAVTFVNLNLADQKELESLPGVGSETARKILAYREQHGLFTSIDDLKKVKGIGEGKFEQIRAHITI